MRDCLKAAGPLVGLTLLLGMAQPEELRLATGPTDGVYHILGLAMKRALAKESLLLTLVSTNGSAENLTRLRDGTADLALMQHDVLGETPLDSPVPVVLLAIAEEPLQIVVAPPVVGDGLAALHDTVVATGLAGSGTRFTCERVLNRTEVRYEERPPAVGEDYNTLVQGLRSSQIQAICFVSGVPSPKVAELLADQDYRLLGLTQSDMQALAGQYTPTSIRGLEYARRTRPIATISVMTLLVSSERVAGMEVAKRVVESLLRALAREDSPFFGVGHGRVNLENVIELTGGLSSLPDSRFRLHPQTAVAIEKLPWSRRFHAPLHLVYALVVAAVTIMLLIVSASREIRRRLAAAVARRVPAFTAQKVRQFFNLRVFWLVARTVSLLAMIWIAGAFVMYDLEREYNSHFASFYDSLLSLLVYLFSGLEDRNPITDSGWAGAVIMLLLAGMTMAYVTGAFASVLVTSATSVLGSRSLSMRDHVLLIGWNKRAERIVRTLLNATKEGFGEQRIAILCDDEPTIYLPTEWEANVCFVRGKGQDEESLRRCHVARARCALILADEHSDDPDGLCALRVLAVKRSRSRPDGPPLICAELTDAAHIDIVRQAGADEAICSEDYGLGLLAQVALQNRVGEVFDELLRLREGSCEVYKCPKWNADFTGKTFSELSALFGRCRGENAVVLIGIQRGGELCLNPREDMTLQRGDVIVVIARKPPQLESVSALPERALMADVTGTHFLT